MSNKREHTSELSPLDAEFPLGLKPMSSEEFDGLPAERKEALARMLDRFDAS